MPTERQIQASRANGARSKGPITAQGKLNSSKNSTRHGVLAQTIVLDTESKSRFEELLGSYTAEFQPRTPAETTLVETMAMARWRQLRVCHLQRAMLDVEIARENPSAGPAPIRAAAVFRNLSDNSHSLDLLLRYETAFERQFTRALHALMRLQERPGRGATPTLPPETISATFDPEDPPELPNEPDNSQKTHNEAEPGPTLNSPNSAFIRFHRRPSRSDNRPRIPHPSSFTISSESTASLVNGRSHPIVRS